MKQRMNFMEWLGILLIALSLGILLLGKVYTGISQAKTEEITSTIQTLLPEATPGFPGEYSDPAMPVLQVGDTDYVGLLQLPAYGLTLPIESEWNTAQLLPCPARFYGSVYDGTMIIGGSDQKGQFDFFDRMNPGDKVLVTDMVGTQFTFTVERIDRAGSATYEKLSAGEFPLTLFVRRAYSSEYILVRCGTPAS